MSWSLLLQLICFNTELCFYISDSKCYGFFYVFSIHNTLTETAWGQPYLSSLPFKFIKITVNIIFFCTVIKMRWCLFDCLSLCRFIVYQAVVDSLNIFLLKLCIKIDDISKSNIDLQQLFELFRHFKLLAIRMTSLPTIFNSSCIIFRRKIDTEVIWVWTVILVYTIIT